MSVSAIMAFTVDGVFPVIFNLYILRLGFGPDFVGQVNSVAALVFSVSALPAGTVGTRFGARTAMIAGVVISLFSTWGLVATQMLPSSLWGLWLTLQFSLLYLGVALYFVNANPSLVNLTPTGEQSRVISVNSALGNLLALTGGAIAGLIPVLVAGWMGWSLSNPAAYRVPLLLSGLLYAVAMVLILRIGDERVEPASVVSKPTGAPTAAMAFGFTLVMLSVIRFLQALGTGAGLTFFNVYMDDGLGVSTAVIGLVVAGARLLSIGAALMVPWATRRWGNAGAAVLGSTGVGLSLIPLGMIPLAPVASASFIAMNAFTSLRYSAYFVYMMQVTPPRMRTVVAGAGEFSGGLSFALVSFVGGSLIIQYGYTPLFVGSGLVTLAGGLLLWVYARMRTASPEESMAALQVFTGESAPAPSPAVTESSTSALVE
jgi:MFS family permease